MSSQGLIIVFLSDFYWLLQPLCEFVTVLKYNVHTVLLIDWLILFPPLFCQYTQFKNSNDFSDNNYCFLSQLAVLCLLIRASITKEVNDNRIRQPLQETFGYINRK